MSLASRPVFSVITASLNAAEKLEGCLASVATQRFQSFEHIVIDGGSTDGTLALLEELAHSRLIWMSEPDQGIAEAMNKGVKKAWGEWLLFLQSDDRLFGPDTLHELSMLLPPEPDSSIWLFPVQASGLEVSRLVKVQPGRIWRKMPGCHQGMVFPRLLFEQLGGYDPSFHICMDYEWLLRAVLHGATVRKGGFPIARYGSDGRSSSRCWADQRKRFSEENRAQMLNAPSSVHRLGYFLYAFLYRPYRWLRSHLA